VDVTVNDPGLAAGSYSGSITVTNVPDNTKTAISVTLTLTNPGGQLSPNGVVNGASFLPGPVSPGLIVTIYGSAIGPSTLTSGQADSSGKLANTVAGAQILFDGVPAPLVYVSATQASAIVPYEVAGQTTTQMQAVYNSVKSNIVAVPVAATAPGVFTANSTGSGQGAIQNQDGSFNSPPTPPRRDRSWSCT
jgi:uncharacterized protein (TIGR03437 family)